MNQISAVLQHSARPRTGSRCSGAAAGAGSAAVPQPGKAGPRRPRGARVNEQALGSAMFTAQAWDQIARSLGLSGRELQIVRGVFDDRIESAIAADLGISAHTVHTYFDRLHRKLGVATRTGLVLRITREFLALAASPQDPVQLAVFAQVSAASASARAR